MPPHIGIGGRDHCDVEDQQHRHNQEQGFGFLVCVGGGLGHELIVAEKKSGSVKNQQFSI